MKQKSKLLTKVEEGELKHPPRLERGHKSNRMVPIYTTTNITNTLLTYRNLLLHKRAFGFAVQTRGGARVRVQIENAVRNLGTLAVIDLVYGVAVLRDEAACLMNCSNTYIMS